MNKKDIEWERILRQYQERHQLPLDVVPVELLFDGPINPTYNYEIINAETGRLFSLSRR